MMGLSLAPATGRMVRDLIKKGDSINPKFASDRFLR